MEPWRAWTCPCLLTVIGALAPSAVAQDAKDKESPWPWVANRDSWRARPVAERHEARERMARDELTSIERAAKKPWRTQRTRHFLVLTDMDKKYVKRAVAAADGFFDWCFEQLDGASDELVRRRLLRVTMAEDPDEYRSMLGLGTNRGMKLDFDRELKLERTNQHGNSGTQFAGMFRDQLDVFLMDKDALLYRYMPGWLSTGLTDIAGTAFMKSGKLVFRPSDDERDEVRLLVRNGFAFTFRETLQLDEKAFTDAYNDRDGQKHCFTKAVRFLVFGPGKKLKTTRGFLTDYMRAVVTAADELRGDWDPKALKEMKVDDEEMQAELDKARVDEWKRRRGLVTTRAFEICCGDWSAKTWKTVEKAFAKYEVK